MDSAGGYHSRNGDPFGLLEEVEPEDQEPDDALELAGSEWDEDDEINLRIIDKVKENPCLWNYNDINYNKKNALIFSWCMISQQLSMDETEVKRRWKLLRSRLRQRLNKAIRNNKDRVSLAQFIRTWKYIGPLLFIVEQRINVIINKEPTSYDDIYLSDYFHNVDPDTLITDTELVHIPIKNCKKPATENENCNKNTENCEQVVNGSSSSIDLTQNNDLENSLLESEKSLGEFQQNMEMSIDADYLFLTSLLPSIKKFSSAKRMELLWKIQKMIYDEYFKHYES